MITEEIRKQHQLSVMDRLKDLIFQEEEEDPQFQDQVDGSVLSKKLGTRDASQISSDLKSNPASLPKRVQLVRMVLNSKAALNMTTVMLAAAFKGTNVKVNSSHPGWVKTESGGGDISPYQPVSYTHLTLPTKRIV